MINFKNSRKKFKAQHLVLILISIQFSCLTYLYLKNPIRTPVTDDWLFLGIGTHETSLLRVDSFELINGHQQFLVKFLVWAVAFLPGIYFSYIWYLNAAVAFLGIYLLISSQIYLLQKIISVRRVLIIVFILCNFKPLHLYMSLTGTGLCLTMLFFGIYYYATNKMPNSSSRAVKMICAFLAPFAGGFGISLTLAHLVEMIFSSSPNYSSKVFKKKILEVLVPLLGLTISYILPTIFNIFNPRSPENSSSKLTNIFDLIKHPARAILFIFGLIGSALTPSSKFDSWLPVILGALVFVLIFWIFLLAFTLNQFTQIIRLNKTPFLGALIFVFMLVFFRGLGEKGSLNEAVAPRYVMGTSLLIASFLVLILERENAKFKVRVPLSILLVVLACSLSGLKTGLEWLSVRSLQTTALYSCIESHGATPDSCLNVARPIEEGDSSDEATSSDLKELSKYLFELR